MEITAKNFQTYFSGLCTFRQFTQWAQMTGAKYRYRESSSGYNTITVYTIDTCRRIFKNMAAATRPHDKRPDFESMEARAAALQEQAA